MALSLAGFAIAFWISVTVDPKVAADRFSILVESGKDGRAIGHGEQVLALRAGALDDEVFSIRQLLARAHEDHRDPTRAIELYRSLLDMEQATGLTLSEKTDIRDRMAKLYIRTEDFGAAADIYTGFLEAAGDAASVQGPLTGKFDASQIDYITRIRAAADLFASGIGPVNETEILSGTENERLAAAEKLTRLGGYYATQQNSDYAAAGLLSAAYRTQKTVSGDGDPETLHTVLLLGPVYKKLGRTVDAQDMYLSALHAQEQLKGSNNPDLSLYIRLLADIYMVQGRFTEAEALNKHIHDLFRDAFGARRYSSNQTRDRRMDVNRPVSAYFPLSEDYLPEDLVRAADFDIPLSKNSDLEEMSLRLARELAHDGKTTQPEQLKALLTECQATSRDPLTLRSAYRSYTTQHILHVSNGAKGTVTSPGTSEHQLGLAVDIDVNRRLMRATDKAYQCFEQNAWRYGFILSYPKGNTYLPGPDTYEPWHWRYVGPQTAWLYREAGPVNQPQEFLSALPCYQARAEAGVWSVAGEEDICLARTKNTRAAAAVNPSTPENG